MISYVTTSKTLNYVSGGRTTRKGYAPEIAEQGNYFEKEFENFFNRLYYTKKGEETEFHNHLKQFDDYWNRRNEVFARTFEVYIRMLLDAKKIKNTFLVSKTYQSPAYPDRDLVNNVSPLIKSILKKGFATIKNSAKTLEGISTPTGYKGFRTTLKSNANLTDTLEAMQGIALRDYKQVSALALELEGSTIAETAENIWNYLRKHTRYKLDSAGIEELRTPSRSLVDGQKGLVDVNFGIDCDDYTILISAMLLHLGIAHEYRVVAYEQKGKFQHIYPVAFDTKGEAFVIDVVPEIPYFNYEEQPIIDLKTISMELHELSGVDPELMEDSDFPVTEEEIQNDFFEELNEPYQLEGIEDDYEDLLLESNFLSGFEEVYAENEADIVLNGTSDHIALLERGILAEVNKARQALLDEQQAPTVLSQLVNVTKELQLVDTLMQVWEDPEDRDTALMEAIESGSQYTNFFRAIKESLDGLQEESLQGFDDDMDEPLYLARVPNNEDLLQDVLEDQDVEDDNLEGFDTMEFDDFETIDITPNLSGFFRKVFRKIRKGVKKVVKAVVRFNPATLVMRGAIILVLKLNLFKFSQKLIYGYLTESQARQQNLDLNEWRKLVGKKNKAENFFRKIGGRRSKFRKAIVRGKAAKKTGLRLSGLGAVATGSTAAASGFIVFVKKLLSSINPAKLFKKIKNKIIRRKPAPVAIPRTPTRPSFTPPARKPARFIPPRTSVTTSNRGGTTPSFSNPQQSKEGLMSKIKRFFSTHKKKVVFFGIGLSVLAVIFYNKREKKKKRSLAGIKAAKTRARNRRRLSVAKRSTPVRGSTTNRKRTTPQLKGRTPARRTTSKGISGSSGSRSNTNRLKAMHRKAKQLQKTHPKTKYSTLLKRAAKQI
ncbi:LPD1 domain-containing protein [Aquimarina algiphila]|nr:LPD1 domain-containing protein [Aquimarina algiphila]